MSDTYGPPIPVNGKMPLWFDGNAIIKHVEMLPEFEGMTSHAWGDPIWPRIKSVCVQSNHPYYQSAEYKASVLQGINTKLGGFGTQPVTDDGPGAASEPDDIKHARYAATLEAAGYTVTPPDPLAADREFLEGLFEAAVVANQAWRHGEDIPAKAIPAAMEYLRANKGML